MLFDHTFPLVLKLKSDLIPEALFTVGLGPLPLTDLERQALKGSSDHDRHLIHDKADTRHGDRFEECYFANDGFIVTKIDEEGYGPNAGTYLMVLPEEDRWSQNLSDSEDAIRVINFIRYFAVEPTWPIVLTSMHLHNDYTREPNAYLHAEGGMELLFLYEDGSVVAMQHKVPHRGSLTFPSNYRGPQGFGQIIGAAHRELLEQMAVASKEKIDAK